MRCQLCDGPIVNGRCRDCGMPYRKDELLYHLIEKPASELGKKLLLQKNKKGRMKKFSLKQSFRETSGTYPVYRKYTSLEYNYHWQK